MLVLILVDTDWIPYICLLPSTGAKVATHNAVAHSKTRFPELSTCDNLLELIYFLLTEALCVTLEVSPS